MTSERKAIVAVVGISSIPIVIFVLIALVKLFA